MKGIVKLAKIGREIPKEYQEYSRSAYLDLPVVRRSD
jgi:hypothetical protein